ncbi:hypothetical protein [Bradyrhizobium sp. LMG 9283]|uniref:hypothetical protein n=1 Tax=Bradyrhizobium sp. LMG 9283 TaxID=592064 RepID=UPI00388EB790
MKAVTDHPAFQAIDIPMTLRAFPEETTRASLEMPLSDLGHRRPEPDTAQHNNTDVIGDDHRMGVRKVVGSSATAAVITARTAESPWRSR